VQQATTPQQRVFVGSLATLPALIARHDVQAPTLIIVGDVVRLHRKLQWFKPQEKFVQDSVAGDTSAEADVRGVSPPAR
ncbi:MAG: siroheme synthase, partial [Halofilum sp. (in: g-proteobacteria)]